MKRPWHVFDARTRPLVAGSLLLLHTQLTELAGHVGTVRIRLYFLVNREDFAIGPDIECPTLGGLALRRFIQHAILCGNAAVGVTEDRVVSSQRLGELLVLLRRIVAGGEV